MPFKKITPTAHMPRHWAIVGDPGAGKSTFAAQMTGPILVVDSDHRFAEVAGLAGSEVFSLDDAGNDVGTIAAELRANMIGSGVKTIVVDSLTAIISPLIAQAVMANDAGANKNRIASFKPKAMAVRLLQDEITSWGTDTLWVYHTRQARDAQAHEVTSTSISSVELARLRRSLNMTLRVVVEKGRRGITVDWARRGRQGLTLWDDSGCWLNMPAKIEQAVYAGLSTSDQEAIEHATPTSFTGPDQAIAWGFEQGCFKDACHAQNAYAKVRADAQPKTAAAMWEAWIIEVGMRLAEKETV